MAACCLSPDSLTSDELVPMCLTTMCSLFSASTSIHHVLCICDVCIHPLLQQAPKIVRERQTGQLAVCHAGMGRMLWPRLALTPGKTPRTSLLSASGWTGSGRKPTT